ncbi:hypothetical protein EDB83DRAFT_2648144 [Lactarius deliciosus]|nr:hypothetical protein EDB83DRAFT_2648144 [Lactarius deliciosus]
MRQHYLHAGHGSHQFAHLILLPAHVQMFLNPERTNLRSSFQTCPTRVRTVSSPTFQRSLTRSTHAPAPAPPSPQRIMVSTAQTFEPSSPRLTQQQVHQSAPIPLLLVSHTSSPGLTAVPTPNCLFHRMTLCVASTLYDDLHPMALFGTLGALMELALVLTPDVDGPSDEVSLKVLYKQVGSLLPNVQALRTLRLQTMTTEAAQVEEDPSHLVL